MLPQSAVMDPDFDPTPFERLDGANLKTMGFEFVEFDWSEEDGRALSLYERAVYSTEDVQVVQQVGLVGYQPYGRHHLGWRWYDGSHTVDYEVNEGGYRIPVRG